MVALYARGPAISLCVVLFTETSRLLPTFWLKQSLTSSERVFCFAVALSGTEQALATFCDPLCVTREPRTTATFSYSPCTDVLIALDLSV